MPRRYQNKHDWAINPTPLIPMPGSIRRICSHGERVGALPTERAGVVEPHGEGEVTRGMRCDELAVKEDLCVVENSIEAEVELSSSCRDSGAELRRQRQALSVPRLGKKEYVQSSEGSKVWLMSASCGTEIALHDLSS